MRVSQHLNPRKQVLFQNVLKPYILKTYIYYGRRLHFFFLAEILQKTIFNWSSVVFRSIMHTLVGILLYTTHQNPVLMTRNETELGSIEKCSDFQKTVLYCYISRLCYFCLISNSKAIMYKTSKELFYKLFIWYAIYCIYYPYLWIWIHLFEQYLLHIFCVHSTVPHAYPEHTFDRGW